MDVVFRYLNLFQPSASFYSHAGVRRIPAEHMQRVFGSKCIDLVSAGLGGKIVAFSDEWFADAANLLTPTPPVRIPGKYVHTGAWYDGWETRRHNKEEADWVIIKLGVASGIVHGAEVDTAFFDGNHAPAISVEGLFMPDGDPTFSSPEWAPIIPLQPCGPSQRHLFLLPAPTATPITHVRLRMYPDGGIARFRLLGTAVPVFPASASTSFDLASVTMGGVAVACSDEHFGRMANILLPGRGTDMGDGWETKRSRGAHADWVVVRLGARGTVERVVVDTAHFRGNFPQQAKLEACDCAPGHEGPDGAPGGGARWEEVLLPQACGPDREHAWDVVASGPYTHVRLTIIPDGGVKRLRVIGKRA